MRDATEIETFALEEWFEYREFSCEHVLGTSDVEPFSLSEFCGIANLPPTELFACHLGYSPNLGTEELRAEVACLHGKSVRHENVLITCGASEAIFLTFLATLRSGVPVVVGTPCYQALKSVPKWLDADIHEVEVGLSGNLDEDTARILDAMPSKSAATVLTNPGNPTGALFTEHQLISLLDGSVERGAKLICDEVYAGVTYCDRPFKSVAELADDLRNIVVIGSMSKVYGLPGLRVGWIVADADLIQTCKSLRRYTTLATSSLGERLAIAALQNREAIIERTQHIADANLKTLEQWMSDNKHYVRWTRPKGGLVCFPELIVGGAQHLCSRLATQRQVVLVPGDTCFGVPNRIRFGLGKRPDGFRRGLGELSDFMAKEYSSYSRKEMDT